MPDFKQSKRFLEKVGPALAEPRQPAIQHDYWDRTWDTLRRDEREDVAAFFLYWLMDVELLKRKAGVDVIGEKVQRRIRGRDVGSVSPDCMKSTRRFEVQSGVGWASGDSALRGLYHEIKKHEAPFEDVVYSHMRNTNPHIKKAHTLPHKALEGG